MFDEVDEDDTGFAPNVDLRARLDNYIPLHARVQELSAMIRRPPTGTVDAELHAWIHRDHYIEMVEEWQVSKKSAELHALLALSTLASEGLYVNALVAAGTVQSCVGVLRDGPKDAMQEAACVLGDICDYQPTTVDAAVAAGAVELCVSIMANGPENAMANTAGVLAEVSKQEEHRGQMLVAVPALCGALHNLDDNGQYNVAVILAYFSNHLDSSVLADVVSVLVQDMSSPSEEKYQLEVVDALASIVQHEQHVDTIVTGGAIPVLKRLSSRRKGSKRLKACAKVVLDLIKQAEH